MDPRCRAIHREMPSHFLISFPEFFTVTSKYILVHSVKIEVCSFRGNVCYNQKIANTRECSFSYHISCRKRVPTLPLRPDKFAIWNDSKTFIIYNVPIFSCSFNKKEQIFFPALLRLQQFRKVFNTGAFPFIWFLTHCTREHTLIYPLNQYSLSGSKGSLSQTMGFSQNKKGNYFNE